jgi:hypothetical protein
MIHFCVHSPTPAITRSLHPLTISLCRYAADGSPTSASTEYPPTSPSLNTTWEYTYDALDRVTAMHVNGERMMALRYGTMRALHFLIPCCVRGCPVLLSSNVLGDG